MDVAGQDPGLLKLVPADGPEIEPVGIVFIFPILLRDLFSIMDELGAAGSQRRADGCNDVIGPASEPGFHDLYG